MRVTIDNIRLLTDGSCAFQLKDKVCYFDVQYLPIIPSEEEAGLAYNDADMKFSESLPDLIISGRMCVGSIQGSHSQRFEERKRKHENFS